MPVKEGQIEIAETISANLCSLSLPLDTLVAVGVQWLSSLG